MAHRRRLALPLPDLGLLEEEETVDEHEGHRDQANAKRNPPDSVQGTMVVLAAGLAEDCQQDAQNSRVHQVTPALHAHLTFNVLAVTNLQYHDWMPRHNLPNCALVMVGRSKQSSSTKDKQSFANLHAEGADNHLSAAEPQRLVGLSALGSRRRRQRVLTTNTIPGRQRDMKVTFWENCELSKASVTEFCMPTCKLGRVCAHPKMNCEIANMMAQPWMVTPLEAVSKMPPMNMKAAVSAEPHLRPIWSAM